MLAKISFPFLYSSIDNAEWRGLIQNLNSTVFNWKTHKSDIKAYNIQFSWFCNNVWFTCIKLIDIEGENLKTEAILGIDILTFPEGFPTRFQTDYTAHSTELGLRSSQILLNLSDEDYCKLYDYYSKLPSITNRKSLVYTIDQLKRDVHTKTLDNIIGLDDSISEENDTT